MTVIPSYEEIVNFLVDDGIFSRDFANQIAEAVTTNTMDICFAEQVLEGVENGEVAFAGLEDRVASGVPIILAFIDAMCQCDCWPVIP